MKYPEEFINKIICGDWLRTIKIIPDNSIGEIITDPPFDLGVADWDTIPLVKAKTKEINFLEFIEEMYLHFKRILKGRRVAFIWIPKKKLYELHKLDFDFEVFIETKNFAQGRPKNILVDAWVPILMFRKGEERIETKGGRNWFMVNTARTSRGWDNPRNIPHPTVKDIYIVKYFIEIGSNKNDIILDPFCGSGTTLVGAKGLKRRYIGIDSKLEYCQLAERRLSGVTPPLF